jgi:RNA ligase (TIGR02306 family)
MRKLATIDTISSIIPHNNADSLELAIVRGWQVVVRKNEFKEGDKIVFFEIDSWIPTEIAPFLSKGKEPREYEGIKGERLRTVKLRGEISQGLILPISIIGFSNIDYFGNIGHKIINQDGEYNILYIPIHDGVDITELLGIQKWEEPVSANLAGKVKGSFPSFIPKTDQERVQNCFDQVKQKYNDIAWTIDEKLDGTSCTVFSNFSDTIIDTGICSRNLLLKLDEENKNNTYVKTITEALYLEYITKLEKSIAIQGEICGPGVQENKYKLKEPIFFVFDIYDINKRRYLLYPERWEILKELIKMGVKVEQVPYLGEVRLPDTLQECLEMAVGKSKINPNQEREGIVFKGTSVVNGIVPSFKAISNKFLLEEKK